MTSLALLFLLGFCLLASPWILIAVLVLCLWCLGQGAREARRKIYKNIREQWQGE